MRTSKASKPPAEVPITMMSRPMLGIAAPFAVSLGILHRGYGKRQFPIEESTMSENG